jgi:thiamine-phosphate pyrophosphorylase
MTGAQRRARLADARLYLCTPIREDLSDFLDAVLRGGVDIVQLRDKDATPQALLDAAPTFRAAADAHGALFILNDRPDLVVLAHADGVHLGQEDGSAEHARTLLGADAIIGRSTHAPEEIVAAAAEPVDYLGVGPVMATPTKPGRAGVGYGLITYAAEHAGMPFFVTGGMDPDTIPAAKEAGAHGVVVVRALTEADDPQGMAERLVRAWG